jgi:hypothetical protein
LHADLQLAKKCASDSDFGPAPDLAVPAASFLTVQKKHENTGIYQTAVDGLIDVAANRGNSIAIAGTISIAVATTVRQTGRQCGGHYVTR